MHSDTSDMPLASTNTSVPAVERVRLSDGVGLNRWMTVGDWGSTRCSIVAVWDWSPRWGSKPVCALCRTAIGKFVLVDLIAWEGSRRDK
jgi:hypothetical protein